MTLLSVSLVRTIASATAHTFLPYKQRAMLEIKPAVLIYTCQGQADDLQSLQCLLDLSLSYCSISGQGGKNLPMKP